MFIELIKSYFHSFCKSNDAIYIFSSATHVSLLRTSENKWVNTYFTVDVQKTDAFGAMKFMRRTSNKMNFYFLKIYRIMPHGLTTQMLSIHLTSA